MFCVVLALCLFASGVAGFSCKDQSNRDVDWFMAYKMPILNDNSIVGASTGKGFYYMDGNSKKFAPSIVPIDLPNQALEYTLRQLYGSMNDTEVFYALYNDDAPTPLLKKMLKIKGKDNAASSYGVGKGILFFNHQSGVWLVHSVPNFPSPSKYGLPDSSLEYGQNFFCASFNYVELENIGEILYYNYPNIYSYALPQAMESENPYLDKVLANEFQTGTIKTSRFFVLRTPLGTSISSYAKTGEFNKDLYDGLVAPQLRTGFNVESWKNGNEAKLDCTSTYRVYDVLDVKVGKSKQFESAQDHSKFAVSRQQLYPYICFSDSNRMTTEFNRGGGAMCIRDFFIWREYSQIILDTNACQ